MGAISQEYLKKQFDFLLVGFVKAGTTSLDSILRQDRRIQLPRGCKETHYFDWYNEASGLEPLLNMYYPRRSKYKLIGGIEPTYHRNAKEVFQLYGKDIKLIFLMRNPVEADYSLFRMALKYIPAIEILRLYRRSSAHMVPEMYDYYTRKRLQDPNWESINQDCFVYQKWIQQYLNYFNREQMLFLLFEDFKQNPQKIIAQIEKFLGLNPRSMDCEKQENQGFQVSRNYLCAQLSYGFSIINQFISGKKALLAYKPLLFHVLLLVQKFTITDCEKDMLASTRKLLENYYTETKKYIACLLDREMDHIWF